MTSYKVQTKFVIFRGTKMIIIKMIHFKLVFIHFLLRVQCDQNKNRQMSIQVAHLGKLIFAKGFKKPKVQKSPNLVTLFASSSKSLKNSSFLSITLYFSQRCQSAPYTTLSASPIYERTMSTVQGPVIAVKQKEKQTDR